MVDAQDGATLVAVPGPFTMSQQAQDDHYGDEEAAAVNVVGVINLADDSLNAATTRYRLGAPSRPVQGS